MQVAKPKFVINDNLSTSIESYVLDTIELFIVFYL